MTSLNLIRLPISLSALGRWAGERGIGWTSRLKSDGLEAGAAFDEGRVLHHLLSESFGKAVLQPFRLMAAPRKDQASLYAYSPAGQQELRETWDACALPETARVLDPAKLEIKPMPEAWRSGRRLGFETRVRPVLRLLKPCGKFGKGAEIDVFLTRSIRSFPEGVPADGEMKLTREIAYSEWLAEKLGEAAEVTAVRLTRFARHKAARGGRSLQGPDATLQGEIVIRDAAQFARKLAGGVGRHTAYGFGMLLIRPPGS